MADVGSTAIPAGRHVRHGRPGLNADARLWQVGIQLLLLTGGALWLDFSLQASQFALALAAALLTQMAWLFGLRLKGVGYLSALITGCGIALLLRADNLWVHPLAACLAISAKFSLRHAGKHIWNPANFGVIVALLLLPSAWASPGQWGQGVAVAVWLTAFGALVSRRAGSSATSWCFLLVFLALAAARFHWLGYEAERIPELLWKQASNGALLLFAFFMLSDPMTLPNHWLARLLHASIVAALAFVWQFLYYANHGPLWALFLLSPLTILWDRWLASPKPYWFRRERQPGRVSPHPPATG